jgi:hypothetical protein
MHQNMERKQNHPGNPPRLGHRFYWLTWKLSKNLTQRFRNPHRGMMTPTMLCTHVGHTAHTHAPVPDTLTHSHTRAQCTLILPLPYLCQALCVQPTHWAGSQVLQLGSSSGGGKLSGPINSCGPEAKDQDQPKEESVWQWERPGESVSMGRRKGSQICVCRRDCRPGTLLISPY